MKIEIKSFFPILTIVFVIAKIGGWLDWSWWWVFSPMWIPLAILFSIVAVVFILCFLRELSK